MMNQRVVVKINFRADTIEEIEGWKKKSKKHSKRNISLLQQKSSENKGSSAPDASLPGTTVPDASIADSSKVTNEVEIYFPADHIVLVILLPGSRIPLRVSSIINDKESGE